jgi:hypothetical protein
MGSDINLNAKCHKCLQFSSAAGFTSRFRQRARLNTSREPVLALPPSHANLQAQFSFRGTVARLRKRILLQRVPDSLSAPLDVLLV